MTEFLKGFKEASVTREFARDTDIFHSFPIDSLPILPYLLPMVTPIVFQEKYGTRYFVKVVIGGNVELIFGDSEEEVLEKYRNLAAQFN